MRICMHTSLLVLAPLPPPLHPLIPSFLCLRMASLRQGHATVFFFGLFSIDAANFTTWRPCIS